MIPDIGIMVGFYVFTRCVSMFGKDGATVSFLAVITAIVAVISTLDLVLKGFK